MFHTKDFLGRELREGDFITYSVAWGSQPWLTFGRIARIEPSNPKSLQLDGELPPDDVRLTVIRYQTAYERIDSPNEDRRFSDFSNPHKRIYLRMATRAVKVDAPDWVEEYHSAHGVPGQ